MPYICKDCKNKTRFLEEEYGSYSITREINEEGDYGDTLAEDKDTNDTENLRCFECGSHDIENVEYYEWENWVGPSLNRDWKARYTKKTN